MDKLTLKKLEQRGFSKIGDDRLYFNIQKSGNLEAVVSRYNLNAEEQQTLLSAVVYYDLEIRRVFFEKVDNSGDEYVLESVIKETLEEVTKEVKQKIADELLDEVKAHYTKLSLDSPHRSSNYDGFEVPFTFWNSQVMVDTSADLLFLDARDMLDFFDENKEILEAKGIYNAEKIHDMASEASDWAEEVLDEDYDYYDTDEEFVEKELIGKGLDVGAAYKALSDEIAKRLADRVADTAYGTSIIDVTVGKSRVTIK